MGDKHHKIAEYSKTLEALIKQGFKKRDDATELISATKLKIQEAKELGIDITRPDRLLKKAQTILKNTEEIKDYDDALKYAENSNKLVTKSITNYNQANKIILSAKEKHSN
ncbi:MAG: hypothetical protein KAJ51_06850, partial [Thermoplasmata archaeon]|nr:hypothetical protein [Thermoplasmata archaeon]